MWSILKVVNRLHVNIVNNNVVLFSRDVNKDSILKAKVRTKDFGFVLKHKNKGDTM